MLFKRAKAHLNDNLAAPAMSERQAPESITHIGRDARIDGGFTSSGDVTIDGTIFGVVRARRCVIEADGVIEGEVLADEIVVRGTVRGPLRGYHVHLEASAIVVGDVVNDGIIIDHGAELTGTVWRKADPLDEAQPEPQEAAPAPEAETDFAPAHLWPEPDTAFRPIATAKTFR